MYSGSVFIKMKRRQKQACIVRNDNGIFVRNICSGLFPALAIFVYADFFRYKAHRRVLARSIWLILISATGLCVLDSRYRMLIREVAML